MPQSVNKRKKLVKEAFIAAIVSFLTLLILLGIQLSLLFEQPSYFEKAIVFENITYINDDGETHQYHIRANDNKIYKVVGLYFQIFPIDKFERTVHAGDTIILLIDKNNRVHGITKDGNVVFDFEEVKKKDKNNIVLGWIVISSLFGLTIVYMGYCAVKIKKTPIDETALTK